MRSSAASSLGCLRRIDGLSPSSIGRRYVTINSAPSSSEPSVNSELDNSSRTAISPAPDARFEVLGSPISLLSVSLSASQTLYTRRGTLIGVQGKAENAISTLSLLEPIRRAALGIPFLYQRVSSTSPLTLLLSSRSPLTSMVTVHMDGRQDWIISQRNALLAWTGHTLTLKPKLNAKLSLAHWGNTFITGRGLLALTGRGQIYQVDVKAGESYIAHPSNVVAYISTATPPLPYRFKSSSLRFQVPNLGVSAYIFDRRFFRVMSETPTWRFLANTFHTFLTWSRRSIWGDRLFLRFEGPTTLLLQSRASRVSDVLTLRDVEEIASAPPGAVDDVINAEVRKEAGHGSGTAVAKDDVAPEKVRYASVGRDGRVEIGDSKP